MDLKCIHDEQQCELLNPVTRIGKECRQNKWGIKTNCLRKCVLEFCRSSQQYQRINLYFCEIITNGELGTFTINKFIKLSSSLSFFHLEFGCFRILLAFGCFYFSLLATPFSFNKVMMLAFCLAWASSQSVIPLCDQTHIDDSSE